MDFLPYACHYCGKPPAYQILDEAPDAQGALPRLARVCDDHIGEGVKGAMTQHHMNSVIVREMLR